MRSRRRRLLLAILPALVLAIAAPAFGAVNDPEFPAQWGLHKIQAEPSWATSGGKGTIVAVADSGVDFTHPELKGKSAGSFSCYTNPCTEKAGFGGASAEYRSHGTIVAGVVAATTNNAQGIASVAPEALIMSLKVCGGANNENEFCDGGAVSRAIRFATDKGAKVINLSLGDISPGTNTLFGLDDFTYAFQRDVVVVAASGNQAGQPISSYAGAGDFLLVVGATGPNDEISSYTTGSSNDLDIDLYAPGGNGCSSSADCIVSTSPGGKYDGVQGTSVAAPHVAGAAAQLRCLGLSPSQTASVLKQQVDRPNGVPRLNAFKAVKASQSSRPCGVSFPVSAGGGGGTTPRPKTQAPAGGGGQPGQTQGQTPGGVQAGAPAQGQPGAPASEQNPTGGELAKAAEEKKSNKTLINVLIGAVLVAAIGAWYGYSKWKASRVPAD